MTWQVEFWLYGHQNINRHILLTYLYGLPVASGIERRINGGREVTGSSLTHCACRVRPRASRSRTPASVTKQCNLGEMKEGQWYKIISLTKFSIPLSLRIYMTSYLFSLLTVTTHALHLMSLSSNHHHHPKSLIDSSDMLHLIFGTSSYTSLRIPHPNHSSPSRRPSFEHAGLTCYTLLSPSITFSLFHSELKTYLFRKSYPPP